MMPKRIYLAVKTEQTQRAKNVNGSAKHFPTNQVKKAGSSPFSSQRRNGVKMPPIGPSNMIVQTPNPLPRPDKVESQ